MRVVMHKNLPIKMVIEFEFENEAERWEFMAHVQCFKQPTAIKVERDGSRRVVPMTKQHTKDHVSAKDFIATFCDTPDGVTLRDLFRMSRDLGYSIPTGTISSGLATLVKEGVAEVVGKRNNGLPGSGNKDCNVYRKVRAC